jgi:hypothetical protein
MTTLADHLPPAHTIHTRLWWADSRKVVSVACIEVDVSLGLGVYVSRLVFLNDFDPIAVPRTLVDASYRATIAVARGGRRLVLETEDTDRMELMAKLYIVDPPDELSHLIVPVTLQGESHCGVSVGKILQHYQELKFPKKDIQRAFCGGE